MASKRENQSCHSAEEVTSHQARRRGLEYALLKRQVSGTLDLEVIPRRKLEPVVITTLPIDLNAYIILGEKPTYPFDLVTLKASPEGYIITDTSSECSTVFWKIEHKFKGRLDLIVREPDSDHIATLLSGRNKVASHGYRLSSAHSAWDFRKNNLAQILVWTTPFTDFMLFVEFYQGRYRGEYVSGRYNGDMAIGAEHYSVCFAGLNGPEEFASIRFTNELNLVVFETHGNSKFKDNDTQYWITKVFQTNSVDTCDSVFLSVFDYQAYLTDYLIRNFYYYTTVDEMGLRVPLFSKRFAAFYSSSESPAPGVIDILYGAYEEKVSSYWLFALELKISTRTVKVRKVSKLGGIHPYAIQRESSASLLTKAVAKCMDGNWSDERLRNLKYHKCDKATCLKDLGLHPSPKLLAEFSNISLPKIDLPENGVTLVMPFYNDANFTLYEGASEN